jgi:sterol desaturase/sphingolipid hydroxylase (fatty acid hydroxylase superfamily)
MALEDTFGLLMPVTFVAFLILERVAPGRALPRVRGWLLKGLVFFVVVAAINGIVPALAMQALGGHTIFHLQALGTLAGAAIVILANDLAGYWIHRGLHTSERVWRWTHQMHHSAERLDMAGAAFFHPLDVLAQQVLPSVVISAIFGVTPLAAALAGFSSFFFGVSPHLNVRTPAWLGYVFQRPEMHAVHHQRGVHAYNYGMLALSDLLFGTWRNPPSFPAGDFGFWDGASTKLGSMLLARDVGSPVDAGRS